MTAAVEIEAPTSVGSRPPGFVRLALRRPSARIGLLLVGLCCAVFVLGPRLAPYDPVSTGLARPGSPPSGGHWLGTDGLGRDVLSRLLTGGVGVIVPPLIAVALSVLVGGLIGLFAGVRGGWLDTGIARVMDVLMAVPALVIALVIIARWGGSVTTIVVSVAIVYTPRATVVLRGAVRSVRGMNYVRAAEARGDGTLALIGREILPNVTGPALVEFGIRLTYAVLFVATMNVLGFGAQPPSSNWGVMIAEGRQVLSGNVWASLAPALMVAILVVGINLVVDACAQELTRAGDVA